ncbi:MAG: beta-N-acetylhexosaminidase [Candidatus Tumulicola sp.]
MKEIGAWARGVIAAGFDDAALDPDLPRFGGYVLFARNAASLEAVRALTDALRARCGNGEVMPLVAVDQEGGRVARLRQGVERMPSMMALGAVNDLELAGRAGEQTAFDLRRAGCTLNFAPVLDLARYPENTVIGTRSLGSGPQAVAALGAAFGAGLTRGGVLPCYKHFPGHGATPVDSHAALPVIDLDASTLRRRDLVPFATVARQAPAIMGTHAVARAFDANRPATLSRRIATDLLRGELGFGGVFVTDCLQMAAVAEHGDVVSSAVSALVAGADLLTVSHSVALAQEIADAIERAVRDGSLSSQRLQEAYARVIRLRESAARPLRPDAFPPHPGIGREIGRRAITSVRGFAHADPLTSIAISFDGEVSEGINVAASKNPSLRREAPALEEIELPLDPDDAQLAAALEAVRDSGRRPLLLARRAHLHPQQARAIARIVDLYADAVVVSMLEPFDLALFSSARHVLAAYGDDPAAIGGLADVLFGGSPPEGRLPVEVAL